MPGMTNILRKLKGAPASEGGQFASAQRTADTIDLAHIHSPAVYSHFAGSGEKHREGDTVEIDGEYWTQTSAGRWESVSYHEGTFLGADIDTYDRRLVGHTNRSAATDLLLARHARESLGEGFFDTIRDAHYTADGGAQDSLAAHADVRIRGALACNANLSSDIVTRLQADVEPTVRASLALNESLPDPVTTLGELSQDEDRLVRRFVAENKFTRRGVLDTLALDPDPAVRSRALSSINSRY